MKRFERWLAENPRATRLISMSALAGSIALTWWANDGWWAWLLISINVVMASFLLMLWRRSDALAEFKRLVWEAVDDGDIAEMVWAIAYQGASTKTVLEMNDWLWQHDFARTHVDDMPASVRQLRAIVTALL